MYYFEEEQSGYNSWGYPVDHQEDLDDEMKDTSLLDKIPGLPDIKFPPLPNLPSLGDLPSMPSMPSMPSLSAPSLSMPSLSMPSLGSLKMPSMPKKKETIKGGPIGRIQMHGAKIKRDGKKLTLTNCSQIKIFKDDIEQNEGVNFNLECETEEEAISWYESMAYGGAEKQE